MSNLNDYYQRIKANLNSSSDVRVFGWRRLAMAICALAILIVMGFLFNTYPLEAIILLLFVGSVLVMERG